MTSESSSHCARPPGLFRDPATLDALRARGLPLLAERGPKPITGADRAWLAGCDTGEEAYSLAILLAEAAEPLARWRVYATDADHDALARARRGAVPLEAAERAAKAYRAAGGAGEFGDYYSARGDEAVLAPGLQERLVFGYHDLARDPPPHRFGLVVCRERLPSLPTPERRRAFATLTRALTLGGLLVLGPGAELERHTAALRLEPLLAERGLYRRVR